MGRILYYNVREMLFLLDICVSESLLNNARFLQDFMTFTIIYIEQGHNLANEQKFLFMDERSNTHVKQLLQQRQLYRIYFAFEGFA